MSNKLSLMAGWLIVHRSEIQFAVLAIVFALALVGMLAPQMRMLAEDAPGGGHG